MTVPAHLLRPISALLLAVALLPAQDQTPGQRAYDSRCGRCHGGDGRGSDMAPSLIRGLFSRDDAQLAALIRNGIPGKMPGAKVDDEEMKALLAHTRVLRTRARQRPIVRETVELIDGRKLEGDVLSQGFTDKQLRVAGKVYLLRRATTGATGGKYREVTSTVDWPGYNGDPRGNRYTTMTQITKANVGGLTAKWVFPIPNGARLQGTPVVVGGIMYVTDVNQCFALDAGTGRQIWHWRRPITPGTVGASSNRGVAVIGERVFLSTDHAHLVALNRYTGEEIWDVETADYRENYFATGAPLAVGNLVLAGVGGGEHGTRGFIAAYDATTGKQVWRFWTIPAPGEPGAETWQGKDIAHGGAPTWLTGSYDPELDTIYWPIGNPAKEYEGKDRQGDNLYSDCVVALDSKTGKLKWHFQFTPHDLWDWDATETPLLINADWEGKPRKLLLHGNRNGFFYVLDRTNGKPLLIKQFIEKLTWATGMTPEGRPIFAPNQKPTPQGTLVCPSQDGASNFYSPSYIPSTGIFYFQTFEKCSVYTTREQGDWAPGKAYLGGSQVIAPGKVEHYLRALDIRTGKTVWTLPQPGPAQGWGGTIATAAGLIFFGEENGAMMAADATTGKPLWRFETNQNWKASPMAYQFDGKQFIAAIAGGNVLAFGLPD
jgi:alcohol dehydrogenase (cytochrome c)